MNNTTKNNAATGDDLVSLKKRFNNQNSELIRLIEEQEASIDEMEKDLENLANLADTVLE